VEVGESSSDPLAWSEISEWIRIRGVVHLLGIEEEPHEPGVDLVHSGEMTSSAKVLDEQDPWHE
jgi:hypothetical protein